MIIEELEKDINYFKNIGFDNIAAKFERDLSEIKRLTEVTNGKSSVDTAQ